MMHIGKAAAALGGEVVGHNTILCLGPGHSPKDRSLSVKLDPTAPDEFLTYSHAGDDWRLCRDHVRARLGLPPWRSLNYAPKVFAAEAEAKEARLRKTDFEGAMRRLFADKKIVVETYGRPSNPHERIGVKNA
jgi:hypothetical protein